MDEDRVKSILWFGGWLAAGYLVFLVGNRLTTGTWENDPFFLLVAFPFGSLLFLFLVVGPIAATIDHTKEENAYKARQRKAREKEQRKREWEEWQSERDAE